MPENTGTTAGMTIIFGAVVVLMGVGLLWLRPSAAAAFIAIGVVTMSFGFYLRARVMRAAGDRNPSKSTEPPRPTWTRAESPKPSPAQTRGKMDIGLISKAAELPGEIPPAKPTKLSGEPGEGPAKKGKKSDDA